MLLNSELQRADAAHGSAPVPEVIDGLELVAQDIPLPELRQSFGEVVDAPLMPPSHINVGTYTVNLLVDVRQSKLNTAGIADGKVAADGLFAGDCSTLEDRVAAGYRDGKHPNQIYHEVAGDPVNYDEGVMVFPPNTPVLRAALDLRPHQERTISDGRHTYSTRSASDGRFKREHEYPHDIWGIGKGNITTGNADKVVDYLDLMVRDTLRKGKPANGIIVDGEREPLNYYDGRASRLSMFYLVRILGEHYGEDVYAHKPYIKAMELLWDHFNPTFPQNPVPDKFNAYRRGIITPEGWRVSRWGDDTNNGKPLNEYLPRLEMAKEDLDIANEIARRAEPENRDRARAKALVDFLAAPESGRDFDEDRWAKGQGLSNINTTHIIPNDLQCEMADAAEVLMFSWDTVRRGAAASGNSEAEEWAAAKVAHYGRERDMRVAYINKYAYNPDTGGFEDVELIEATSLYDTQGTFSTWERTGVISSTNNMGPLYSGAVSLERSLSAKRLVERELLDRGGIASTNSHSTDHGQWAGDEAWMIDQRLGACGAAHAAARFESDSPEAAEEFLVFGEQIQLRTLRAVQEILDRDHVFPEHWNARDPIGIRAHSEYPHQQNLAMTAEGAVELSLTDLREKARKLAPVAGRFVVAYSPRRRQQIFA